MNRMTRYLLHEQIKIFSLCLTGLMTIYLTVDIFEKIRSFITYKASLSQAVLYFLFRLPQIFLDTTPMAILLATFLTLGLLSRRNELIAMKTGGIHLLRIVTPFLVFGLITSLVLLLFNYSVIPTLNRKADFVRKVLIEKKSPDAYFKQGKLWFRQNQNTLYNIQVIEAPENQLLGITIYKLNKDFGLLEEVEAKEMRYEAGSWVLLDGMHRRFFEDGKIDLLPFSRESVELKKTPDEFKQLTLHHEEMSYPELANYVSRLKQEGYHFTKYAVDLYRKTSFPFASLVMAVLAIPFALREGIRTNLTRGIGLSLLIGVCYWIILSMILSLGHSGVLPPLLSAWLANLLFLALGFSLFLTMRQ